ncbi:MAG: alpha/beta hydrolase-fold protein [Specibacter sp.]
MNLLSGLSLLDGPLPVLAWFLGAAAVLFLVLRRSRAWLLFTALGAAAAVLLSMAACWAVIHVFYWWPEDLPAAVVLNVALVLWVLVLGGTTALAGLRRRAGTPASRISMPRRGLAVLATATVLAAVGFAFNATFGEFPTVSSLVSAEPVAVAAALPRVHRAAGARFMNAPVSRGWKNAAGRPSAGSVLSVPIPGTSLGFEPRNALVYLPPAYAAPARPVLPVLILVSGQPGSPESWLRSTDLVRELDAFAAAHGGLAPIVVAPDPNGSDGANTMCMNSAVAQADTYMSRDVPAWIKAHLDADTNPAHWAVGGFSYGGTCALQLVTRHPGVFQSFMAISPEREPALAASRSVTVQRAFHGDTAAFDAQLPLTLLTRNAYPHVRGWFAAGASDALYSANVRVLVAAARGAGMNAESESFPGGHSWAVANAALPQGLNVLAGRLGLQ